MKLDRAVHLEHLRAYIKSKTVKVSALHYGARKLLDTVLL